MGAGAAPGLTRRDIGFKAGFEGMPSHSHEIGNHHHVWLYGGAGANLLTGNEYTSAVRYGTGAIGPFEDGTAHPNLHGGYITSDDGAQSSAGPAGLPADSNLQPSLTINYMIRVL